MKQKIALQLYSLRNSVKGDFKAQLQTVAAIGYRGVEFAGMHGISAEEMKPFLEKLKLHPVGAHTPFNELENNLDEVIAYHRTIGTQYLVIPYGEFRTKADAEKVVSLSKRISPQIRAAGMRLLYHNHSQEFTVRFDGKTVLELLRDQTSPEELGFELDVFWAVHAGFDPVEIMEKFGHRCVLVHAKDMNNIQDKKMTEVGTGIVDFRKIIAQCNTMEHAWMIVEQDEIDMDEYKSVEISLKNLQKM